MIITRSPFRISFAGGGSDLKEFYEQYPGCVLSTTIDKYVYIAIHPFFDVRKTQIKYSRTEIVDDLRKIEHPIVRQCLLDMDIQGIDINSIADIPAGTGLGSSSTFTVTLLHALYAYSEKFVSHEHLAREACEVEIEKLGEPIGKQDQYAAAYGGLNFISFYPDGKVNVEKIIASSGTLNELEESLMMFYTGSQRSTKEILSEQKKNMTMDGKKINNLIKMTELAKSLKGALEGNNLDDFGRILHEGWMLKKELAGGISNESIDHYYNKAIENGALGGKLLGAGGSGFLLFFCNKDKQKRLKSALSDLRQLDFKFDDFGSQVIYIG